MKRDINYALMGLLLLTIVSVVGLSVYYKYTFHDLGKRYTNARAEIEVTYNELNRTQHELNDRNMLLAEREKTLEEKENLIDEYFSALDISRQRESSLGDMFNQLRTENALYQKQLSDTQQELDKTVKDFGSLTKNFNEKNAQLDTFKNLFGNIDASVLYLNDRATEIRYKVNDLDDGLADMDDSIGELESGRVKDDLRKQHNDMEAALNQLEYSLSKLETKLNDTEYYAGRIRNL
ncbi:MAG: hypothetical protein ABH834_02155 [Candidatus Altiarchaeota archaeon]